MSANIKILKCIFLLIYSNSAQYLCIYIKINKCQNSPIKSNLQTKYTLDSSTSFSNLDEFIDEDLWHLNRHDHHHKILPP